jgi:hypothetical protein
MALGSSSIDFLSVPKKGLEADTPGKRAFRVPIFFIEYLGDWRPVVRQVHDRDLAHQENTAVAMRAVWFAVHDLRA